MGIASRVAAARHETETVRGIGEWADVEFRLRRVRSADLLAHGRGSLLAALPSASSGPVDAASVLANPRAVQAMQELARAVVCAAVVGTRPAGREEWDAETFTMREADADVTAERVWIDVLPDALIVHLAGEANRISGGSGEVAAALATFRPGSAGGAGRGGEALRGGPVAGASVEPGSAGTGAPDDGGGDQRRGARGKRGSR